MEAPHLTKLAEKYKDSGLVVLAVNVWNEPPAVIKRFVKKLKLKHQILLNGDAVFSKSYGLRGVPHTFWIDREGKVFKVECGFDSPRKLQDSTEQLLKLER